MKVCSLCGNTMQDTDQFCTSCGATCETEKKATVEAVAVAVPSQGEAPAAIEGTAVAQATMQPQIVSAPENSKAQGVVESAPTPLLDARLPNAPGGEQAAASADDSGQNLPHSQERSVPRRPLYGTQSAYGQLPTPYAQQNTYAPYSQGTMPPPPMRPGGMYQAAPMVPPYLQNDTVSLGEWLLNYLIMMIPIVNIIMLCVWGFGNDAKPSVRNWARAGLIWMGISFVLVMLFTMIMVVLAQSFFSYGYYGF